MWHRQKERGVPGHRVCTGRLRTCAGKPGAELQRFYWRCGLVPTAGERRQSGCGCELHKTTPTHGPGPSHPARHTCPLLRSTTLAAMLHLADPRARDVLVRILCVVVKALHLHMSLNGFLEDLVGAGQRRPLAAESTAPEKTRKKQKKAKLAQAEPAPEALGISSILQVEHTVHKLQQAIKLLVEVAPTPEVYASTVNTMALLDEGLVALLRNNSFQLAMELQKLRSHGQLSLFDEIVNYDGTKDLHGITGKLDRPQQTTIPAPVPSSTPGNISPPKLAPLGGLPPLPPIKDKVLEARVFTHKLGGTSLQHLSQLEKVRLNNERLEFLGDSILHTVLSIVLYEQNPGQDEGLLLVMRQKFENNVQLAKWAIGYGFNKRLHLSITEWHNSKDPNIKAFADVFEAYIGALAVESNYDLQGICQWIGELVRARNAPATSAVPVVVSAPGAPAAPSSMPEPLAAVAAPPKDAKQQLYLLIGTAACLPSYNVLKRGDGTKIPFQVEVKMGSDTLGVGEGLSKKAASAAAAKKALANRALVDKWSQIRRETPRATLLVSHK